jgi:hypothetical protein
MSDVGVKREQGLDFWLAYQHHKDRGVGVIRSSVVSCGESGFLGESVECAGSLRRRARSHRVQGNLLLIENIDDLTGEDEIEIRSLQQPA